MRIRVATGSAILIGMLNSKLQLFDSQGNLIAVNALLGCVAMKDQASVAGRDVWSYGSPAFTWPSGIVRRDFANSWDPVSLLSVPLGGRITYCAGWMHGFIKYLQCESLRINQYTTRYGLTLRRNNEALAYELVRMERNYRLVHKVVQKLNELDRRDAQEVCCYYVEALTDERLRDLKIDWPELVTLLKETVGAVRVETRREPSKGAKAPSSFITTTKSIQPAPRAVACAQRLGLNL
jgi:hypothetical protein